MVTIFVRKNIEEDNLWWESVGILYDQNSKHSLSELHLMTVLSFVLCCFLIWHDKWADSGAPYHHKLHTDYENLNCNFSHFFQCLWKMPFLACCLHPHTQSPTSERRDTNKNKTGIVLIGTSYNGGISVLLTSTVIKYPWTARSLTTTSQGIKRSRSQHTDNISCDPWMINDD